MSENNENNFAPEQNTEKHKKPILFEEKNKSKKVKVKTRKTKKKGLHIGIGSIVLMVFCVFLLVIATFLQLEITHLIIPAKLFNGENFDIEDFLYTIKYIPQIPIVLFVAALLGRKYGLLSIIFYIFIGLFILPVFALGGGWKYFFEYGFGYILAYIPAVFIVGSILKKGYTLKKILKSVLIGVLTIHFLGILYMLVLAWLKHADWVFISGWISHQSGIKILYDFIFSFFAVLIAKYARVILWFYL